AFLDDAPLEERRTMAVRSRRWLDPSSASDLGALDPAAIERVRTEAWPEPRDPDELHDALVLLGFCSETEGREWLAPMQVLVDAPRAAVMAGAGLRLWGAAERLPAMRAIHPAARLDPPIAPPARLAEQRWERNDALVEILRGRLETLGPVTTRAL